MRHEPINTTTLEEVQENFPQWRGEKPSHNSHIPDYLWDKVAHIVEHYRQSDILKHLKVTRYQLVAAMKSCKTPKTSDQQTPQFLKKPNITSPHIPSSSSRYPPYLPQIQTLTSQQLHPHN